MRWRRWFWWFWWFRWFKWFGGSGGSGGFCQTGFWGGQSGQWRVHIHLSLKKHQTNWGTEVYTLQSGCECKTAQTVISEWFLLWTPDSSWCEWNQSCSVIWFRLNQTECSAAPQVRSSGQVKRTSVLQPEDLIGLPDNWSLCEEPERCTVSSERRCRLRSTDVDKWEQEVLVWFAAAAIRLKELILSIREHLPGSLQHDFKIKNLFLASVLQVTSALKHTAWRKLIKVSFVRPSGPIRRRCLCHWLSDWTMEWRWWTARLNILMFSSHLLSQFPLQGRGDKMQRSVEPGVNTAGCTLTFTSSDRLIGSWPFFPRRWLDFSCRCSCNLKRAPLSVCSAAIPWWNVFPLASRLFSRDKSKLFKPKSQQWHISSAAEPTWALRLD